MVEVRNLTKQFGDFTALQDISLKVENGSVYGLVGYNGAGKTTLLKNICGIYKPEKGEVLFEGENIFVVEELPLMLRQLNHESALTLIEMFKIRQALDASKRTHSEVKTYMKRLHGKKTEFIMED